MRVICINEDAWPIGIKPDSENGLIRNGEVYEVVDVELDEGYIWYTVSIDESYVYWENCFARCSDIDETELIKERQVLSFDELVNSHYNLIDLWIKRKNTKHAYLPEIRQKP